MAVHLPSDLVLDVMRSADPVQHRRASAKLQSVSDEPSTAFSNVIDQTHLRTMSAGAVSGTLPGNSLLSVSSGKIVGDSDHSEAYRGFERMVLRNLFESLLPKESSGAFGQGASAGIWRSLTADHLAGIYTENGGIGLSEMLTSSGMEGGPRREVQWPYFNMNEISTVRG